MKKIILIVLSIIFTSNISYAEIDCKVYNGLLEIKKYNKCIADRGPVSNTKLNDKEMSKTKSAASYLADKLHFGKLNTDSKLTDWIKKTVKEKTKK